MPAFDNDLMFRTTGDLTQSETSNALTIRGTGIKGMAARVVVPTAFHDDDTLQVLLKTSDDDNTYSIVAQSEVLDTFKSNPRDVYVPLVTNKKYVKMELVVTSADPPNINFGGVRAGLVLNVGYDWERAKSFE